MIQSINILHITDLHLDKALIEDFELNFRKSLKEDALNRSTNQIDLLFITGDIVDKGGVSLGGVYNGLKRANEKVITPIAHDLSLSDESIFIVPGNHDIERSKDKGFVENGLKVSLITNDGVRKFIKDVNEGNYDGVKRILDYDKFQKEFYFKYSCKVSETFFTSTFIKEIHNIKIGISCLNSAWRCYSDDDEGNLLIGEHEVLKSLHAIEDCGIKIALVHHHINFLSEIERKWMESKFLKEYDMVFFGHAHNSNNYLKTKGGNEGIWIGSPSAFLNAKTDSIESASGYSICKLSKTKTKIEYRYYSHDNTDFRLKTEVGKDGYDTFRSILPESFSNENDSLDIVYDKSELDIEDFSKLPKTVFENKLNLISKPTKLFTGRKDKLEELKTAHEQNKIICITGIGGIGKTQLVLKFLDGLEGDNGDRITWQDFAESTHFDNFITAAGFGIIIQSNKTEKEKFSAFVDKLNEHQRIVIWDNFHSNTDRVFDKFLQFAEGKLHQTNIFIISRTSEKTSKFKNIELTDFKESIEYVNVLLNDRHPTLKLSDEEIATICQYVKGHPLALELTLNLCKSVPLNKVVNKLAKHTRGIDELSQRLFEDILEQGNTSQAEKDFLYQFSIFKGKVSKEAIEAIFGEDCFFAVLPALKAKYLIEFESNYYDTHPLIREFCYQKLENKEGQHTNAAKWLINQRSDKLNTLLEERIFHHLKGAERYEEISNTIGKYGRDYIRQAFFEPLESMISSLNNNGLIPLFDFLLGEIHRLKNSWNKALFYYENAINNSTNEELVVESLSKCGDVYRTLGENNKALEIFKRTESISKEKKIEKYIAWSYNNIAIIKEVFGYNSEALHLRLKALKISAKLGIQEDVATLYNNIGSIYSREDFKFYDLNKSFDYRKKALKLWAEIKDKLGIAISYGNIGNIYSYKNFKKYDLEKAFDYYKNGLEILLEIGDKANIATFYRDIGTIYSKKDFKNHNLHETLRYFRKSLRIDLEIDSKPGLVLNYEGIGHVYNKEEFKDYDSMKALAFYEKSLGIAYKTGDKFDIARLSQHIYVLYFDSNNYKKTIFFSLKAYAIYKQLKVKKKAQLLTTELKYIKREISKELFMKHATSAIKDLEPELSKEIVLSDFLNEPVRVNRKPARNEKVVVKYLDDRTVEGKYKKFEKHIEDGKCKIITRKI